LGSPFFTTKENGTGLGRMNCSCGQGEVADDEGLGSASVIEAEIIAAPMIESN